MVYSVTESLVVRLKVIATIFCAGKMVYTIIAYWEHYFHLPVLFSIGKILDETLDIISKETKIPTASVFISNESDGRKKKYLYWLFKRQVGYSM